MTKDVSCPTHGDPHNRMGSLEACGCKEACDATCDDAEPCVECGFYGPGGYMFNTCTCGQDVSSDPYDV